MRLDDLRSSGNVEDRRGFGGVGLVGGGGIGMVALLLISWFFGIDPSQLLGSMDNAPVQQQAAGPRADDAAYDFARKIVGSAEDVWQPLVQSHGARFVPATLTAYDYATPTGCGQGQAAAGPFYCPSDAHIYLDLSFFNELGSRFGAPGEFARAYVIAHEYGHHIQNLLGTMDRRDAGGRGAEGGSVRTELQADCFAGVWAYHANQRFKILESGDVESGVTAAAAVGDDTLSKREQGYVVPDSFTHGTSAQRVRWFRRGLASGDPDSCDTFAAGQL
jgi:predicted metalloprotease